MKKKARHIRSGRQLEEFDKERALGRKKPQGNEEFHPMPDYEKLYRKLQDEIAQEGHRVYTTGMKYAQAFLEEMPLCEKCRPKIFEETLAEVVARWEREKKNDTDKEKNL